MVFSPLGSVFGEDFQGHIGWQWEYLSGDYEIGKTVYYYRQDRL
jgi:hypothetical protein